MLGGAHRRREDVDPEQEADVTSQLVPVAGVFVGGDEGDTWLLFSDPRFLVAVAALFIYFLLLNHRPGEYF